MASDLIGKGVFATVRLENSPDGSSVAVKVYEHRVGSPGSDLQRMHEMHLANEVRLAGRLAHPHIIAPQEVRVGGSRTELTMEYAPHGTLEAYALRLGPVGLPETDGRRLFSELVSAVQYLHGQGVAHRDVKLENVMLDVQWRARLIDFGSAHEVKPSIMATGHKALTTHAMQSLPQSPSPHHGAAAGAPGGGSVFNQHRFHWMQGTPGYMGPEVLQGALSGRGGYDLLPADVWSLGVCLYCLFNQTGLPFRGKDAHELLKNASSRPHPPLSHLSRNGTDLLNQLLANRQTTDRVQRTYQSMSGSIRQARPPRPMGHHWALRRPRRVVLVSTPPPSPPSPLVRPFGSWRRMTTINLLQHHRRHMECAERTMR